MVRPHRPLRGAYMAKKAKRAAKGTRKSAAKKTGGKKRTANAAFMRPVQPDDTVAAVVGSKPILRTDVIILSVLAVFASGCGGNSTTAPSGTSSTTTTTVAPPSISETWQSVLPVRGFKIYSFGIPSTGTVNITLTSVGGQFVPSTVQV